MSSLTETASTVKKIGVLGIISTVVVVMLIISVIAGISIKNKYFPSKEKAVVLSQFGQLDKISNLNINSVDITKLNFQVETVSNDFGVLPQHDKVYKFVLQSPAILGLENAKLAAEKMGFVSEPQVLEGTIFQWVDDATGRTLTYNIVTKNFNIESSRIFSPEYVSTPVVGNEEAIRIAKQWLSANDLYQKDFEENKTSATPIKVEVTTLKKALSLSEANYVQVSFRRKNINELPLVEASENGLVSVLVTGVNGKESVAQVNYRYNEVDTNSWSFYPFKTSEEAFAQLKGGEGQIISSPIVSGTVFIRKVYLAYYLTDSDDEYLQPVVVFDSLDGFLAIVPAIKDDQLVSKSLEKSKTNPIKE